MWKIVSVDMAEALSQPTGDQYKISTMESFLLKFYYQFLRTKIMSYE